MQYGYRKPLLFRCMIGVSFEIRTKRRSLVLPSGDVGLCQLCLGNSLFPNGTKPLHASMLTLSQ